MSSKFEIETLKIVLTNFMVIMKGMYWNVYGIRLLSSHKIYFVIACWRPAVRSGNVSINTKVITVNQMIIKPCQIYSGAKITKQWILELRSNISSLLPEINPAAAGLIQQQGAQFQYRQYFGYNGKSSNYLTFRAASQALNVVTRF